MRPVVGYWVERVQSLAAYLIILGIVIGVCWIVARFTRPDQPSSSTTIGDVKRGGTANITNINNPVNDKQGLYLGLSSDRATFGVFKQMTNNFRLSLGAGQTFEGEAVAEVRGEVSF